MSPSDADAANPLAPVSAHRALKVAADGSCRIEGLRCDDCGAVVADQTIACRRCASRGPLVPVQAIGTGVLYSWTVVHRSYPGTAVPFVSAVVDLDGGLTVKGTLQEVSPDDLRPGLPVRVVYDDAGGAVDAQGTRYAGFHFVPAGDRP
jgi:uncharacterized OB-fold protein